MDVNKLAVYVTVGGEVIKIARGTIAEIRAAFKSNPSIEVDNAQLDKIDAEYSDRIERARRAAEDDPA